MVHRGSYANDLGTIFDGSLRMGSHARRLHTPGSSWVTSRENTSSRMEAQPHARFLSTLTLSTAHGQHLSLTSLRVIRCGLLLCWVFRSSGTDSPDTGDRKRKLVPGEFSVYASLYPSPSANQFRLSFYFFSYLTPPFTVRLQSNSNECFLSLLETSPKEGIV
jgi:hypothetical protein